MNSCCRLLLVALTISHVGGFSINGSSLISSRSSNPPSSATSIGISTSADDAVSSSATVTNNVLILDHLNINHEAGRHDWLVAFYVDFLGFALDPRKMENLKKGKKTLWCNIGAHQLHLPEGKPDAQVLEGSVTLAYGSNELKDLASQDRLEVAERALAGSKFEIVENDPNLPSLSLVDPWGSKFHLVKAEDSDVDHRGRQDGDEAVGVAIRDIKFHVGKDANLAGIGRFYSEILGANVLEENERDGIVRISMGPHQTLTFQTQGHDISVDSHVELQSSEDPKYPQNFGPHISMYVADLPGAYRRADALGLVYVNPRFSRQAYTLEEAIDDCMFRCLDIVDPLDVAAGAIIRVEHEVRSVVKRDGSKYKSCPFDSIPEECTSS